MGGLAGGSTYLALLALCSYPYQDIPKIALVCNLVVSFGGFILFYQSGYFSIKKTIPFVVTSIPMAYWGGSLTINKSLFTMLLCFSLLVASVRLLMPQDRSEMLKNLSWREVFMVALPLGGLLGFLSGVVGIGGGIYLIPLLVLMKWSSPKEAAASSSFFIFLNSLAGIFGQCSKGVEPHFFVGLGPLVLAVLIGGQIGSRLGSRRLPQMALQRLTAVLILFVAIKLLIQS